MENLTNINGKNLNTDSIIIKDIIRISLQFQTYERREREKRMQGKVKYISWREENVMNATTRKNQDDNNGVELNLN